jgi:transglutaminase/protease-like cytokinesis protein 3
LPEELSPLVRDMPPEAERSIESVAAYLKLNAPSSLERLKAAHDYVADRVAYDAESYFAGRYPPQDARTVFETRKSVCAGYANLLTAIGRAAELDVRYVVGDGRPAGSDLSGESHAWNAAQLDGRWYLIDATWDSGAVGQRFEKNYRTAYFLTPPAVFALSHFPDEAKWQLLERPLSRGDFLRQPALSPLFFATGLELVAPDRSQVDVSGTLEIQLKSSRGAFLLANVRQGRGQGEVLLGTPRVERCQVDGGAAPRVRCQFGHPGRYDVQLFVNPHSETGTYDFAGQIKVNAN